MTHTHMTGVIRGFYSNGAPAANHVEALRRATPPSGDISEEFINLPTSIAAPSSHAVYVVHEIRVIQGKTQRRVIGVYESKRDAERKADEVEQMLVGFLEKYNGRPFDDEMCGGTLVTYWHAGNPLRLVGFKVWVEEVLSPY